MENLIKELGPGQYPTQNDLNNVGKFYNSKYGSSKCGKVGNSDRFPFEKPEVPGPGKCTCSFM